MRVRDSRAAAERRLGVALALALGLARPALAGPPTPAPASAPVEFRWDAPSEGCPGEPEVLAELERLLGTPLAELERGRLTAIARVRLEADGRWDLRLWTVGEADTRQRSMVGRDCKVLADAAALLAAMAIDPNVLARIETSEAALAQAEGAQDVAEPEPVPEPDPVPEPEPDPEPAPEHEPDPEFHTIPPPIDPPRPRPTIGLRAQGGVSLGDLPDVGPVVRLALAMQWWRASGPGVRVELEGHYGFTRAIRLVDEPERGGDLQHAFAALRGCPVLRHAPSELEFPICAGVEAGALIGEGVGFPTVGTGAIPWVAVDLALGIVWNPVPRFALGLTAEPWVALTRQRFRIEGEGVLWRPLPLGFRALGGFEVRF